MSHEQPGDLVPNQDEHEAVVEELLDGSVEGNNEAIDDLDEITGGQSPTEGEHNTVVGAVNDILAALRNSKILPTPEEEEGP